MHRPPTHLKTVNILDLLLQTLVHQPMLLDRRQPFKLGG
jgi:hypothetical protein